MIRCSYHSQQPASAYCTTCGRPLCAQCDHRVKGRPHCQECIVQGIELLRVRQYTVGERPPKPPSGRPWRALLFGIIPGLGAVYNRQNAKAFLEFTGVVGLAELAEFSQFGLFGALAAFLYIYSLVDAFRTARAIRAGRDPAIEDDRLRRILGAHTRGWALVLVLIGGLFMISHAFNFVASSLLWRYLVPLGLVLIGLHLLRERWRSGGGRGVPRRHAGPGGSSSPALYPGSPRLGEVADPAAKAFNITTLTRRGGNI